jgi:hypothetical protein
MSDLPTHAELALEVNAHTRDLNSIRPKVERHETHVKNCVNATLVRAESMRQITQLRAEFASEQAAMLGSATRILEGKAQVIDKVLEAQELESAVKREVLKSKRARDKYVKRVALYVGAAISLIELGRLVWPWVQEALA